MSCGRQPLGQEVKRLSADVVAIYDPAGEAVPSSSGGLVPSNNPYATNGVVVYAKYRYQGHADTTAMEAVCVLPTDEHATCSAVLEVFVHTQVAKFT
jgi:protoporphyrinogen oxidase